MRLGVTTSTCAVFGALLLLSSSGCVAVVHQDVAEPSEDDRTATEPICVDWRLKTQKVGSEALGYWGTSRSRVVELIEEVVLAANLAPPEHVARPTTSKVLRLSLTLEEVRSEPGYALNLLSVFTLALVPFRTEYELTLAAEQTEPELKVEASARIVSWTQLFLIFYPGSYSETGRSGPLEEALRAAARQVCGGLIRQAQEARVATEREGDVQREDLRGEEDGSSAPAPTTDYRGPLFGDEPEGEVYPGPVESGHGPVEDAHETRPPTGDETPPRAPGKRRHRRLSGLVNPAPTFALA